MPLAELKPGEKLLSRRIGQEVRVGGVLLRVTRITNDRVGLAVPEDAVVIKREDAEMALLAQDA